MNFTPVCKNSEMTNQVGTGSCYLLGSSGVRISSMISLQFVKARHPLEQIKSRS